jgi:hypothetical protein
VTTNADRVGGIIVHESVAVIVEAVAVLRAGFYRADADFLPVDALLRPQRARENAGRPAMGTYIGQIVVDDTVAVIVDAVADLRNLTWHYHVGSHADDFLPLTCRRPLMANDRTRTLYRATTGDSQLLVAREIVVRTVNFAVAVVVYAIATKFHSIIG